jgi:excisionase family DNA binding protein
MRKQDDNSDTAVMSIEEAGRKLDLSRNGAYAAAARGEIPTIRIGRLLKVPKTAFQRLLDPNSLRRVAAALLEKTLLTRADLDELVDGDALRASAPWRETADVEPVS